MPINEPTKEFANQGVVDRFAAGIGQQVGFRRVGRRSGVVNQDVIPRLSLIGLGAVCHIPLVIGPASFVRSDDRHQVLVVANLSRFSQAVELDLSRFRGLTPVEMFGQSRFVACMNS